MAQQKLETQIILGGKIAQSFNNLSTKIGLLGAAVDQVSSKTRDFEKESVEVYRNYEDAILDVKKTYKDTYSSMTTYARDMQSLEEYAQQWASTSIFHTNDVASAMAIAAKSGWNYEEMLQGIPKAMLIAQAGGLDLATGVDYLTKIMNSTQMPFSEMGTVIDQWSKAADSSATNIGEMGEAFMTLAASAQFGDTTAELFTMLGVMANFGITGSQAGTALRGAMVRLVAPTKKAEDAMSLLGVEASELNEVLDDKTVTEAAKTLEGLGFSAYDSEGNLLPMIDVFTNLHQALQGLEGDAQNEIISAIFPTRNITAAKAFLNAISSGDLQALQELVEGSEGYAQQSADIMMSGLTGSVETLLSKWEEFERSVGETLAPGIESVASFLGTILDVVNNADETQLSTLVGAISGISAAGPGLLIAAGAMKLFSGSKWVLIGAGAVALAAGIGAVVGFMQKSNELSFKENFGQMELDLDSLKTHVDDLGTSFNSQITAISEWETALETAEKTYATKSSEMSELLLQDVLEGKTLSDPDRKKIHDYAGEIVQATLDGVKAAKGSDIAFLEALFGDAEEGSSEAEALALGQAVTESRYSGLYQEAYNIGDALRQQLVAALKDKTLDENERQAIQATVDRLNEIEAQIASRRERAAYYTELYKAQSVSSDTINAYLDSLEEKRAADAAELEELYAQKYGNVQASFQEAIAAGEATEDDWDKFTAEFEREKAEALQELNDKYGNLASAAIDALFNDSGFADVWKILKNAYDKYGGIPTLESGGWDFDKLFPGMTRDQIAGLVEQFNMINNPSYQQKYGGYLSPYVFAGNDAAYAALMALQSAGGFNLAKDALEYGWQGPSELQMLMDQFAGEEARLAALQKRQANIEAGIAQNEGYLNGTVQKPFDWYWNNGELNAKTKLYGSYALGQFTGGGLYDQKQEVNLDIDEAEDNLAKLKEQIEALGGTVEVRLKTNDEPSDKDEFAEGGRATTASIFGEAGAEWAIPEAHTNRTADLLNAARAASGFTWGDLISRYGGLNANAGSRGINLVYSPTINAGNASGVSAALASDKNQLMRMLKRLLAEQDTRDAAEVYA